MRQMQVANTSRRHNLIGLCLAEFVGRDIMYATLLRIYIFCYLNYCFLIAERFVN